MNNFNNFSFVKETLLSELLDSSKNNADPVHRLNLEFMMLEKERARTGEDIKKKDLDKRLCLFRESYFEALRSKTKEAYAYRVAQFNKYYYRFKDVAGLYVPSDNYDCAWQPIPGGGKVPRDEKNKMICEGTYNFWEEFKASAYFNIDFAKNMRALSVEQWNKYGVANLHNWEPGGWPVVLKRLNGTTNFTASLLHFAFPPVDDYLIAPDKYYYMIDFMENVPWPSYEQMDLAAKKACMYGADEYEEDAMLYLNWLNDVNNNEKATKNILFNPPRISENIGILEEAETTYGLATLNKIINFKTSRQYADEYKKAIDSGVPHEAFPDYKMGFKRKDTTLLWWWPRPRLDYAYVSKIGFINPRYFIPTPFKEVQTPYGYQKQVEERIRSEQQKATRRAPLAVNVFNMALRDPFKATGLIMGSVAKALNPAFIQNEVMKSNALTRGAFRDIENFTGGFLTKAELVSDIPAKWVRGEAVTTEDLMQALDFGIKSAIIAFSGGSAASFIGVGASQLQEGSWGQDEFGSVLLGLAEVTAIANVSDRAIDTVVNDYVEKQVVAAAKKEVYKRSNLDETILGTLAVELGVSSGHRVYRGESLGQALSGGVEKSALIAMAKTSPEAAIIAMAYSEVSKNGINHYIPSSQTMTSPQDWFNNFEWSKLGPEIQNAIRRIDAKDAKKIVGLSIMLATGRISSKQALNYMGQEFAIRQIDRFHQGRPVSDPNNEELAAYLEIKADVDRVKNENLLLQNVRQGHVPSPSELSAIADSGTVNYLWDSISSVVPESEQSAAWDLQFSLGLPDWSIAGAESVPEWAKIGSTDVPKWAQITGREEWNQKLQSSLEKKKQGLLSKAQWNVLMSEYLASLWPPGTPLKPFGSKPGNYNFVGPNGKIFVRKPLDMSFYHPMVRRGLIKKKYSEKELQYLRAREKEIIEARKVYEKITGEVLDTGSFV